MGLTHVGWASRFVEIFYTGFRKALEDFSNLLNLRDFIRLD